MASAIEQTEQSIVPYVDESVHQSINQPVIDELIVLMGPTGSGKSSFSNLLAGREVAKVGHNSKSCTHEIKEIRIQIDGRNVLLIDSPGFDDTYQSDYEILCKISEWLELTYHAGIRVTGIICLREITETKMRGSSLKNLAMFRKLCGTESLKNVTFVTTKWDEVILSKAEERQKEMETDFIREELSKGAKLTKHDNTIQSATQIIRDLLNNPPIVLAIQKQLVDEKRNLVDTDAGGEINEALIKRNRSLQKELEDAKAQYAAAVAADAQNLAEMRAGMTKQQEEMEAVQHQLNAFEEGEAERRENIEALKQKADNDATSAGKAPDVFMKDILFMMAPLAIPVLAQVYSTYSKNQADVQKHLADVERHANETKRFVAEEQRKAVEAQLKRDQDAARMDQEYHMQQQQFHPQHWTPLGQILSMVASIL